MNKEDNHDTDIIRFPDARQRKEIEKSRRPQKPPGEPFLNLPPVVKYLGAVNIVVFLLLYFFPSLLPEETLYALAFVPGRYSGAVPFGMAALASPFTHMFIHAGWLHLLINVGTLMAFGAGLEKNLGGKKMLAFYFATGLFGALAHTLTALHSDAPMIGASGAISGLFGGVLMMMHVERGHAGYRALLPFVAVWIGISLFFGLFGMPGTDNPIAWTTHVGGFIGGLLLYKPVLRFKR